jgi:hypothetical protein
VAKYLEYDADGRIVGRLDIDDPMGNTLRWYRENSRIVEHEHVSHEEFYVNASDEVVERPTLAPAITAGERSFTISGLPVPCVVAVDGVEYPVEDGSLEFETTYDGTHSLRISAWPYRVWNGSVTTG